jgi:hypothetical protein
MMIVKAGGNRRLRRKGALGVAGALSAAAAVAALAGCGSAATAAASTPTYAQVLALAQCMRSHGVPDFPDPNSSGNYTMTSSGSIEGVGGSPVNIGSSQAQAAYGDCRHVLPGAPSLSQLEQGLQQAQQRQAQQLPQLLKWEQCVRSHGEPDFSLPLGGQTTAPSQNSGVNPNSPQFQAALSACQQLLPAGASVHVNSSSSSS